MSAHRRPSPSSTFPLTCVFVALVMSGALACQAEAPPGLPGAAGFGLAPCSPPGVPDDAGALCGSLPVAENPAEPEGRSIDLHVVVLPATGEAPKPDPILFLEGGPGVAATPRAAQLARSPLRERRAIVLVDQRGTGRSNPLHCTPDDPDHSWQGLMSLEVDDVAACRRELNADLRFYHTTVAMDDLDALRRALGVEALNLWGGSYGSRAALVYLRRHGEHVRSVLLLGVAPPSLPLPREMPRDAQAALDALFAACDGQPSCRNAYPLLERRLNEVLTRLEDEPVTVRVDLPGSEAQSITVTRDLFAGILRFALYDTAQAARVPAFIQAAHQGDFRPLARFGATFGRALADRFHVGMTLSVVCTEDVVAYTPEELTRAAEGTFMGSALGDNVLSVCAEWPRGRIPADFHEPVVSDVPVLMLAGAVDPVTPPRHAQAAARHLPNSRVMVMPHTGHFPPRGGCVPGLMRRFIETADPQALDGDCLSRLERPEFALP